MLKLTLEELQALPGLIRRGRKLKWKIKQVAGASKLEVPTSR